MSRPQPALKLRTHVERDVRLESGERLPDLATGYVELGRLDAARSNAVLILHGYTTGPAMLDPAAHSAERSWSGLVGPGRAIDTDRYYVICPNMLGSCYGSTGPGSIDPRTRRTYGSAFPRITVGDIVSAQARLADALGIERFAAVAGPSLGAFQVFEWATHHPQRVARAVAAVGSPYGPFPPGFAAGVLASLEVDPGWRDGRYADTPGSMVECLTRIRIDTLMRYGIDAELRDEIPDAVERQARIVRLAREWASGFDAGSLFALAQAAERFDVRPDLQRIRAPLLYVISRSDPMFTPALARGAGEALTRAAVRWSYIELDSDKGHLASGSDSHLWSDVLASFMATDPTEWRSWGQTAAPTAAVTH